MDNSNKIIIVTHNHDKVLDVLATLTSKEDNIRIARTFTTDFLHKDAPIQGWKYYMDNDNLYLAYKNNAILCISTDDNQVSEGITKEEYSYSDIIPMTYQMFNMISPRMISGINIAWIDSSYTKNKKIMKDTSEFMQSSKKYDMMYFTDEDDVHDISSALIKYIKSDAKTRNKILDEYS